MGYFSVTSLRFLVFVLVHYKIDQISRQGGRPLLAGGSMLAKGSSSRINLGSRQIARAILTRFRSLKERRIRSLFIKSVCLYPPPQQIFGASLI